MAPNAISPNRVESDTENVVPSVLSGGAKVVPVRAFFRRFPGSAGRTNIREANDKHGKSVDSKMDVDSFRAIMGHLDNEHLNFPDEQRNHELNRENRLQWQTFQEGMRGRRRRKKVLTRERTKQDKALKERNDWIRAINDLEKPLPGRFI